MVCSQSSRKNEPGHQRRRIVNWGFCSCAIVASATLSPAAALVTTPNSNVLSPSIRIHHAPFRTPDQLLGRHLRGSGFIFSNPSAMKFDTTRLFSSASSENGEYSTNAKDRALGISVLLTVPLAWGTYTPVVKYLYEIQPPVPGFVFSAAYYLVASLSLWPLVFLQQQQQQKNNEADEETANDTSFPFWGGLELGSYLFVGNALQVVGLETVPADRAGFLVQLTTVMVPLVQAALAGNMKAIPIRTWISCLLAFTGVIVMGIDGKDLSQDETALSAFIDIFSSFTPGDLLVILAAVSYTLHVVRLGRYATQTTPLQLAASKATAETFLSFGLVTLLWSSAGSLGDANTGILAFASKLGTEISTFFYSISESIASSAIPTSTLVPAIGAVFWTGWVTCAYTIYAQSFGQRRVSPTEANLIYTVQPLFTALFAWVLLGETLGPAGAAGGGLIASAVYMVAMAEQEERDGDDSDSSAIDSIVVSKNGRSNAVDQDVKGTKNVIKGLVKR